MFTGIIEAIGTVMAREGSRLTLARPAFFSDIVLGSSIAVSGVCLSVVEYGSDHMSFDVVPETFAKTTLGLLRAGDSVNVERALSAQGRFDGHVVQGHVEGTGVVQGWTTRNQDWRELHIRVPDELLPFVIPKGSVAIDGVSLTVAKVEAGVMTVSLIPHTLEQTTLGNLQEKNSVNLETDIFVRALIYSKKYV